MIRSVTVLELFDSVCERLQLRWIGGKLGESRILRQSDDKQRRPSLVGYLNIIYPNLIQIIGQEELQYLDALDPRQRWEIIAKVFAHKPAILVLSRDQSISNDLREAADEAKTPIWISPKPGHELLTYIQYHLARSLAPNTTLHGTFMEVYSIGVLITGESGAGKSELALELITRGHRLISDDAPEFTLIAPDVIDGTCPEMLQDMLEVRGLGVLNVREMFGDTSVKRNKYLRLIVHLMPASQLNTANDGMERLRGIFGRRKVLDVDVPEITIPIAPGRNLAVLVEAAVRNHVLKSKGIDPAQTFIDRQAHQMRRTPLW